MTTKYDALLLLSFGSPEKRDDVIPFLENVLHGRNVPRKRMLEVAEHYHEFDGVSPLNAQNRALIAAIRRELSKHGPNLPVYFGNRNWHPLLTDTLRQMSADGVEHALVFVTSAFGSYSGCRQYLEDMQRARAAAGPAAPRLDKLRLFYNHPGFIGAMAQRVIDALNQLPPPHDRAKLIFTAHSIPLAMAQTSPYQVQLREACQLVGEAVGRTDWQLVYQSRSGPPQQPWLEPDICDHLETIAESAGVVIVPIGFLSDHMEVAFDLDRQAKQVCDRRGINMVRADTVGTHPDFVAMIRELTEQRVSGHGGAQALGTLGPSDDTCPADCCPGPPRPA